MNGAMQTVQTHCSLNESESCGFSSDLDWILTFRGESSKSLGRELQPSSGKGTFSKQLRACLEAVSPL